MTDFINPPSELVQEWWEQADDQPAQNKRSYFDYVANCAAQWGADQELEACCKIALTDPVCGTAHQRRMLVLNIKNKRRPKQLSLKEQALEAARIELNPNGRNGSLIIRALQKLPEDD